MSTNTTGANEGFDDLVLCALEEATVTLFPSFELHSSHLLPAFLTTPLRPRHLFEILQRKIASTRHLRCCRRNRLEEAGKVVMAAKRSRTGWSVLQIPHERIASRLTCSAFIASLAARGRSVSSSLRSLLKIIVFVNNCP